MSSSAHDTDFLVHVSDVRLVRVRVRVRVRIRSDVRLVSLFTLAYSVFALLVPRT